MDGLHQTGAENACFHEASLRLAVAARAVRLVLTAIVPPLLTTDPEIRRAVMAEDDVCRIATHYDRSAVKDLVSVRLAATVSSWLCVLHLIRIWAIE